MAFSSWAFGRSQYASVADDAPVDASPTSRARQRASAVSAGIILVATAALVGRARAPDAPPAFGALISSALAPAAAPAAAPAGIPSLTPGPTLSLFQPTPILMDVDDAYPGDRDTIEYLLNATVGSHVSCAVEHALCDISSCTRNDDGATASCGCLPRPASNASAARLALGWTGAVLSHHDAFIAAMHHAYAAQLASVDDGDDDGSFTMLCDALIAGTVWGGTGASRVSLWSTNPYFADDELNGALEEACGGGTWAANCMGAPW